jgi:hypothetical protein
MQAKRRHFLGNTDIAFKLSDLACVFAFEMKKVFENRRQCHPKDDRADQRLSRPSR